MGQLERKPRHTAQVFDFHSKSLSTCLQNGFCQRQAIETGDEPLNHTQCIPRTHRLPQTAVSLPHQAVTNDCSTNGPTTRTGNKAAELIPSLVPEYIQIGLVQVKKANTQRYPRTWRVRSGNNVMNTGPKASSSMMKAACRRKKATASFSASGTPISCSAWR